ncbi:hypothetical protein AKJ16_DCAP05966, partial [Drosera capensis]
ISQVSFHRDLPKTTLPSTATPPLLCLSDSTTNHSGLSIFAPGQLLAELLMSKDFEMKTASKPSREKKRKRERRDVTENIGSNVEVVEDSQKNSSLLTAQREIKRQGKKQKKQDVAENVDSELEAERKSYGVTRTERNEEKTE